jgi:hypothetical protein
MRLVSITHIAFTKEGKQIHPTIEKCVVSLFSLPSNAKTFRENNPLSIGGFYLWKQSPTVKENSSVDYPLRYTLS